MVAQGLAGQKSDHGTNMLNVDKYPFLSGCSEGKALSWVKVLALKRTGLMTLVMLLVLT